MLPLKLKSRPLQEWSQESEHPMYAISIMAAYCGTSYKRRSLRDWMRRLAMRRQEVDIHRM
jgi:hypothetical protein